MIKYIVLLFGVLFQGNRDDEFKRNVLFNGKFVFTIPKDMKEDKLANYFRDEFKYNKYFLSKDSALEVQVKVHYEQRIQLHSYKESEKEELLFRISGTDKKIIGEEVHSINNRTVLIISAEFLRPGAKLEKYIARRMVFNTSAGLVSLNMFYGYDTEKKRARGEQAFKRIIDGVEMR